MNRREMIEASLAAVAGASALASAEPQGAPGAAPRKVLFVSGGWDGHQPAACRDFWVPRLRAAGLEVVTADSLDAYADPELMASVDLVVQNWTMGTIRKEALGGLLAAVRNGTGLAGWHGGLADAFRQETEYQFMVGGQFVAHPGGQVGYRVSIVDRNDPITAGLADFDLRTEQYYMHVDPNNKVLATTRFTGEHAPWIDGATMPVVWKRRHGKGRVFYSSLGHEPSLFEKREVAEIQRRGMLWAAESRRAAAEELVSPTYAAR
jgi:hypothetical protein